MLSTKDYTRQYRDFHIVRRELMPDVEQREKVMFCPACQEQEDDELVKARKLHVSYDEDPLRNYRALVTVACKGCGWSEIIPVEAPPSPTEEEMAALREAASFRAKDQLAGMQNSPFRNLGQSGPLNQKLWGDEMQRQMAKQSMFAQMYGAGPQLMKALITPHTMATQAPQPTRGQALADAIWQDYDALDKMREEAKQSKAYVESMKVRDKMMQEMAAQLSKKIDEDVMSELRKQKPGDLIKVATPKYKPAPMPPAPKLDENDKAEMRRMLQEAVAQANGDPGKFAKAVSKIKEFFR